MTLSPFELNVGHSIYGCAGAGSDALDTLGQGDGRRACAALFARASRKSAAELLIVERRLEAAAFASGLIPRDRLTHDQYCDLVAFLFERAVNM